MTRLGGGRAAAACGCGGAASGGGRRRGSLGAPGPGPRAAGAGGRRLGRGGPRRGAARGSAGRRRRGRRRPAAGGRRSAGGLGRRPSWPRPSSWPSSAPRAAASRTRPSRSALRRTRSAWASTTLDEWLFTPIPSAIAEVERLLVGEPELSCELVDADASLATATSVLLDIVGHAARRTRCVLDADVARPGQRLSILARSAGRGTNGAGRATPDRRHSLGVVGHRLAASLLGFRQGLGDGLVDDGLLDQLVDGLPRRRPPRPPRRPRRWPPRSPPRRPSSAIASSTASTTSARLGHGLGDGLALGLLLGAGLGVHCLGRHGLAALGGLPHLLAGLGVDDPLALGPVLVVVGLFLGQLRSRS